MEWDGKTAYLISKILLVISDTFFFPFLCSKKQKAIFIIFTNFICNTRVFIQTHNIMDPL